MKGLHRLSERNRTVASIAESQTTTGDGESKGVVVAERVSTDPVLQFNTHHAFVAALIWCLVALLPAGSSITSHPVFGNCFRIPLHTLPRHNPP